MHPILSYILGLLTLPALWLAYCLLVDLCHKTAWYCPYCREWAVKSKDNPNRTVYLPNILVCFAKISHKTSKRHRERKRICESYGLRPCVPSSILWNGRMDEIIPLAERDDTYQKFECKAHDKDKNGKARVMTETVKSPMPYIECERDGKPVEGYVFQQSDGSLSLIPVEDNPYGEKQFLLFDKEGNPDSHISPENETKHLA